MKKIGILGGTFDPPHKGHIHIAEEAYKKLNLDEVIFMPAGIPPHKIHNKVTNENIRYDMVKLAIEGYPYFHVSDYEIKSKGLSYTYLTLKYLKENNKGSELYFIAGADSLIQLDKWRNVDGIFENARLVVFGRPGFSKNALFEQKRAMERKYNHHIIYLDIMELNISSSQIRDDIKKGFNIKLFMSNNVTEYIEYMGLYKE